MSFAPMEIEFAGNSLNLWTFSQLECLSKDKLRSRAVDLRTLIGADQMPPVPRHPDDVLMWILRTQCALTGRSVLEFGLPKSHHLITDSDLSMHEPDAAMSAAQRQAPASPSASPFRDPPAAGTRRERREVKEPGNTGESAASCLSMGGGMQMPSPSAKPTIGTDCGDSVAASDMTDVSRAFQETRSVMHSLRERNRGSGGLW